MRGWRSHRPPGPSASTLGQPPSIKGNFLKNFILFEVETSSDRSLAIGSWLNCSSGLSWLNWGLLDFFFYYFYFLLQSVHLFPFPGVIGSKNSRKSAAGLGGGFVGPPHAVPM